MIGKYVERLLVTGRGGAAMIGQPGDERGTGARRPGTRRHPADPAAVPPSRQRHARPG